MKLSEVADNIIKKAGFIPYIKKDGQVLFMFMTSSNTQFGGSKPMISKGGIDEGETPKGAAIREAQEELGLKKSNLKQSTVFQGWRGSITGETETYIMAVYAGEVKSVEDFVKPSYETAAVHWMTKDEFLKSGRESHKHIVSEIAKKVSL